MRLILKFIDHQVTVILMEMR